MKISAKELLKLLAQGGTDDLPPDQQWDVSEEELQGMIDEGVGLEPSELGNLERAFESAGSPERLRIIDPKGNLYDVFIATTLQDGGQLIGVQPLVLKVTYQPNYENFESWDDAESNLPQGWEVYEAIGGQKGEKEEQWIEQMASRDKKWLLISSRGDKIQILKVLDEQDWD